MLELWGQNLTDETYQQVGFDAPANRFVECLPRRPRTYGMTLRLKFGDHTCATLPAADAGRGLPAPSGRPAGR
ncbi:MAG: hypothetical protein R3F00_16180 [Dokdonella sp.]